MLNEKKFHNGNKVEDASLLAFVCASNELPAKNIETNQSLIALWDRITVRLNLKPLQEAENFKVLLKDTPTQCKCKITTHITVEQLKTLREDCLEIPLGEVAENTILSMRQKMGDLPRNDDGEGQIFVSDRRWQQIAQLIRFAALVNGHNEPDIVDCNVMLYSLWNKEEDLEILQNFWHDILAEHAIASELDIEELEHQIENYCAEIQQHYTEETHELSVDNDGFIDFVQPIQFSSSLDYIAVHKDSWKQLQDRKKDFQSNEWWTPIIRYKDNNGNIDTLQNDDSTYCMIDPKKTQWNKTQIINTYKHSWAGPMKLKTRKVKDAVFNNEKFLEQNKSGIAKTIKDNNQLFKGWEAEHKKIISAISDKQKHIEVMRDEKAKVYENNHFISVDTLKCLTEPAAKCLNKLEQLRINVDTISEEYKEAKEETRQAWEEIRKTVND